MQSNAVVTSYVGRFSDGRTAISHPVRVSVLNGSLLIDREDGGLRLSWPLSQIEAAEPITRHAIDVLVHEPGRLGATLFVADPAFARTLAASVPKLTTRGKWWRYAKPWLAVSAAVAGLAAVFTFTDLSPSRMIAELLPTKARSEMGKLVIKSMTGQGRVCSAEPGAAALKVLAERLSIATGQTKTFEIRVVDSVVVNAFAAPGEEIVLLRGLLAKAESADEVAGVLAHEMGHGLELHPETSIVRAVGISAITEFVLGGSGGTIANLGLMLAQFSYSRDAERQADRQALRLLKNSGIATQGFSDFFRRMAKVHGETTDPKAAQKSSDPMDMMRTHPSVAERLANVEAQPKYAATPALSAQQWSDLKAICGAAASVGPKQGLPQDGASNAPKRQPKGQRPPKGETPRDI
jgi:beta-barrel assembly-enhancing protease